jgi:putative acetyltransferase
VASALCDAIEKLAAARKLDSLVVDASDTAKPLFDRRGYIAERRNTVCVEDVWLGNTRMKKKLS